MAASNQIIDDVISKTQGTVEPALVQIDLVDKILNVCRSMSIWPMTFGLACCAIEMMSTGMARFDMARFGA